MKSKGIMEGQYIHEVELMLKKYEAIEESMLIMDDYDGGKHHMVKEIIKDLRQMMWWTV